MQLFLLRRTLTKRHLEFTCCQKSCFAMFTSLASIVSPKRMTLSTCKITGEGAETREQRDRRDGEELRTARKEITEDWGIRILSRLETASPESSWDEAAIAPD